ncbi:MAG: thiamine phosphate synthase [Melioribacteraceae bacterium]
MFKIDFRLYLITNRKLCSNLSLQNVIEQAVKSGLKAVQLRENDLSDDELLKLANQIYTITSNANAKLFINSNIDIVSKINADGIHCKENGLSVKIVRKYLPSCLIGVSVHSLRSAYQAESDGADFIVFGPIYSTPTKITYGLPQGLDKLQEITSSIKLPVFAIGGISPEKAKECLDAGAFGVAVVSSIMSSNNIPKVIEEYKEVLGDL